MLRFSLLAVICLGMASFATATHPEHWITSGTDDLLKGEFTNVALSSEGLLHLAPGSRELLDTGEAFIHAAVANAAGTLFIGTSTNGRLFQVTAEGVGSELAKFDDPAIYALAVDSQNRLYAGTSPQGKVYRVAADGKAEVFFDPGEKFIWDMLFDDRDNLYVATGPKGILYKVTPQGEGSSFFDSEETHLVKLAWDLNRQLLAGGSSEGLLYRLSSDGRPFVLYDSSLEEFKAIAVDRYGNIYAAAISGGGTAKARGEALPAANAQTREEDTTVESVTQGPAKSAGGKLEVYRIDKDNLVELIHSSDTDLAFDLVVRNDGSILLATGNRGHVVALNRRGFETLLVDTKEEQVTALRETGGALVLATSNLGKVYRVSGEISDKGIYESDVLDSQVSARWGRLRWRVKEPSDPPTVQLFTRSGNTAKPDRTWSDWTGPYTDPSGAEVKSAPARFLQWKAEFARDSRSTALLSERNSLELVAISYQQENIAPQLASLTVMAPGVALAKAPPNPLGGVTPGGPDGNYSASLPKAIRTLETPRITPPSRKIFLPGARSFTWKATDSNDDLLEFSIYCRRLGDTEWLRLADKIAEAEYTLDGTSLADGTYELRVLASDRPSNPSGSELTDELISRPFEVSNQLPAVEWKPFRREASTSYVTFVVTTGVSSLYQVDYALDGQDWRVVFPDDGLADSGRETFSLNLGTLPAGSHRVRVRAIDINGNVGTSMQAFEVQ